VTEGDISVSQVKPPCSDDVRLQQRRRVIEALEARAPSPRQYGNSD